ncbi:CPBP family intramembrane metalloprotease [Streptococcus sp. 27098_8_75]|jgi:CAAX amino terminal protease family protein|uniref:CPBP family intramembrane glutamic endopeptidase n=1 Tax=Streptococcus TaxID=1301 RepID=UPI001D063D2C|nr:CPBP family intramembrane glutamic endopeptidase [Streptococcus gordonii]MCB6584175.1 CPBP family intramembrane metalloprotease [Streptococcus gordonii]MCB7053277.1 CPBP family intramembrane metalloprotease [Streptococcus gordonii]MCB7055391.1 CPBP family intramembrane metalloprotease [Streptococcus gordonii]MCG4842225.1 CPBP family intramembrane metalloprotease [Streptococcus gordonii]MCY7168136.1 CPBP family intramembrane metalloprotease [Streptococcus gordonii]
MVSLIQQMTNALIQIVLFMLLPFIWWFVTARRKSSFLDWIGFKPLKDTGNHKMWLWIFIGLLSFTIFSYLVLYTIVKDLKTATSSFSGLGFQALPAVLIYSLFQTSLPEELLFRGFLLKRFSVRLPFGVANTIQAALFGLLHGLMFITEVSWLQTLVIILCTGSIAAYLGFVNEKKSGGSILASWIMHALANVVTGMLSAFLLI